MVRAVLRDGVLVPLDPLPAEWADGRELVVEPADTPAVGAGEAPCKVADPDEPFEIDVDEWYRRMQATPGMSDEDHARFAAAVAEEDRIEKERARKELGLDS
jgi:hypothetical protein